MASYRPTASSGCAQPQERKHTGPHVAATDATHHSIRTRSPRGSARKKLIFTQRTRTGRATDCSSTEMLATVRLVNAHCFGDAGGVRRLRPKRCRSCPDNHCAADVHHPGPKRFPGKRGRNTTSISHPLSASAGLAQLPGGRARDRLSFCLVVPGEWCTSRDRISHPGIGATACYRRCAGGAVLWSPVGDSDVQGVQGVVEATLSSACGEVGEGFSRPFQSRRHSLLADGSRSQTHISRQTSLATLLSGRARAQLSSFSWSRNRTPRNSSPTRASHEPGEKGVNSANRPTSTRKTPRTFLPSCFHVRA